MKNIASAALLTLVAAAVGVAVHAQSQPPQADPPPAPRWPDGRISFSGTPEDVGNWEGPANATLFSYIKDGKPSRPNASLESNKTVEEIPFKPGVKELFMSRI